MRQYQPIWEAIKKVPVGKEVQVKCHISAKKTLRQAVLKEKSRETALRKKLGERYAGNLEIRELPAKQADYILIAFKLSWDGTRI